MEHLNEIFMNIFSLFQNRLTCCRFCDDKNILGTVLKYKNNKIKTKFVVVVNSIVIIL